MKPLHGLATLRLKRGDYVGSIEAYRQLLALTPNKCDAQFGLGRSLAFHGQYAQAVDQYRTMIEQTPHKKDAMRPWRRYIFGRGIRNGRCRFSPRLVATSPSNVEYALGQARTQIRLHDYSNARRTLNAVLKAHPSDMSAELQLADLDIYQGRQQNARRRFNQILRADPTDREAL